MLSEPWTAWALGLNLAANNMSLNCCSVRPRAANLLSDSLVQNHPRFVWVVWLSGGLLMREVRNHGPTNCLAVSAAASKLGVSGSPSNCATILHCDVQVASMYHWETLPNCSSGREPGFAQQCAAPTLPWTVATIRTPSYLVNTGSSPRLESLPITPKSGGHERTVPLRR